MGGSRESQWQGRQSSGEDTPVDDEFGIEINAMSGIMAYSQVDSYRGERAIADLPTFIPPVSHHHPYKTKLLGLKLTTTNVPAKDRVCAFDARRRPVRAPARCNVVKSKCTTTRSKKRKLEEIRLVKAFQVVELVNKQLLVKRTRKCCRAPWPISRSRSYPGGSR
jgi:hypothetical protein